MPSATIPTPAGTAPPIGSVTTTPPTFPPQPVGIGYNATGEERIILRDNSGVMTVVLPTGGVAPETFDQLTFGGQDQSTPSAVAAWVIANDEPRLLQLDGAGGSKVLNLDGTDAAETNAQVTITPPGAKDKAQDFQQASVTDATWTPTAGKTLDSVTVLFPNETANATVTDSDGDAITYAGTAYEQLIIDGDDTLNITSIAVTGTALIHFYES